MENYQTEHVDAFVSFVYIRSTVIADNNLTQFRIRLLRVNKTYLSLSRVFSSRNLITKSELLMYKAKMLPIFLYSFETKARIKQNGEFLCAVESWTIYVRKDHF